ncbi:hypothetical protein ACFZBM_37975 [Streptomyces lavendulae]|uniref:Uncharacterized protein n=1 Tax=Streptomyces lavendulae subsp. lavendulae TaxID=58340 RepID=A0A2K8PU66_STRLA|nr:hypothetical protein [Streptomyces lavendulae]ATZ29383.1 hypothetical protein SLAV_38095 [Streptomyces lavendulae subsp. lavendulae]QUQ59191.1 hypothetical protein SLLC_36235 [Streptomyces lavendulae subsp. lavendulae]
MKPRIRLAVLAPVLMSSLALGSAPLLAASAQAAAVPSLTCSVKQTPNTTGKYNVSVTGAQPGTTVTVRGGSATNQFIFATNADDDGNASTSGFIPAGKVTASNQDDKVTCGTVKQAEQKNAQDQYNAGFQRGLFETLKTCKQQSANQGLTQPDPNYERGYNAGVDKALSSPKCQ